jgi:hypothetical protein
LPSHDSVLLPSHIISPTSSRGSNSSSGPSLPNPGPFTPTSALLPQPFCGSKPSQAELDLQLEMQMQSEYALYSWETNGSLWSTGSDMLLGDNFDLSAVPPSKLVYRNTMRTSVLPVELSLGRCSPKPSREANTLMRARILTASSGLMR